jgi:hypothetical protein
MGDIVAREKFSRGWKGGLPETPCGYGSTLEATKAQRDWIPQVIRRHGITSIVDVGAGDLNWIKLVDLCVRAIGRWTLFRAAPGSRSSTS